MSQRDTFITAEGFEKLKKELKELKLEKRKEIAERIHEAKELGDLSENAEYAEAKDQQAFTEGRIQEIEAVIKNATIIKRNSKSDGTIDVGTKIKIEDRENSETREYHIVGSNEAAPADGKISNESPIGQAFLGKKVGDVIEIKVPQGSKKFKIIAIA